MLLPLLLMVAAVVEQKPVTAPAPVDEEVLGQLLTVRRVYIDRLSGGETALQMRDMIAASLQGARLFVITENPDRADAILQVRRKISYTRTCTHPATVSMRIHTSDSATATQPITAAAAAASVGWGATPAARSAISAARMAV